MAIRTENAVFSERKTKVNKAVVGSLRTTSNKQKVRTSASGIIDTETSKKILETADLRQRDRIIQNEVISAKKNAKIRVNRKRAASFGAYKSVQSAIYTETVAKSVASDKQDGEFDPNQLKKRSSVGTVNNIAYATASWKEKKNHEKQTGKYEQGMSRSENLRNTGAEKDVRKLERKQRRNASSNQYEKQRKKSEKKALKKAQKESKKAAKGMRKAFLGIFSVLLGAILAIVLIVLILVFLILVIISAAGGSSSSSSNTSTGSGTLSGNAYQIYMYLSEKGYGDIQCAAILGNLKQEMSTMDPTFDNGYALGIMQWTDGGDSTQRSQIINWANANGLDVYAMETQLEYATEVYIPANWYFARYTGEKAYPEIYNLSWDEFMSTDDLALATGAFCAMSEKPYYGDNNGHNSRLDESRIPYAQEYYAAIMNLKSSSGTVSADPTERLAQLFPGGTPTSESAMSGYLTSIKVPICTRSGKVQYTMLTVHKDLAERITACFEEMAAAKFPISDAYCYEWRLAASGTGHPSHHSYGCAIDINAAANEATYGGGPNPSSPYYITQDIVQIWKNHGFYWGGDWDGYYNDPMHFTWTNC